MKKCKNIFIGILSAVAVMLGGGVLHAAGNGCDDVGNNMVVPELALCSVHAYNIGNTVNSSDAGERAFMQEIIAMKTTLIAQQMYKHYEEMESMLNRLKTRLQKAVLANDLKVASGDDSSGSSGGDSAAVSDDKYRVLAGANNCNYQGSVENAYSCLQSNARIVSDAIAAGNTSDARKQLEKDLSTALSWAIIDGKAGDYTGMDNCNKVFGANKSKKRDDLAGCAQELLVKIATKSDARSRELLKSNK